MYLQKLKPEGSTYSDLQEYIQNLFYLEVNSIKNPIAYLHPKTANEAQRKAFEEKQPALSYREELPDGSVRQWSVELPAKESALTAFDRKIFFAVQKLITDDGFPPDQLYELGSLRNLCKVIKINPDSGKNQKKIKHSLQKIASTTITTNRFYLKGEKDMWKKEEGGGTFHFWDFFWYDETLPNGEEANSIYLYFHPPFFKSLKAYYVKPLDFNFWLDLTPLSQRLYELTSFKFYGLQHSEYAVYEYEELCDTVPLKEQEYKSWAEKVLEPAHEELMDHDWFKKVEWKGDEKGSDMPLSLYYYPGKRAEEEVSIAKERLEKFKTNQSKPKLKQEKAAELNVWMEDMKRELEDEKGKNEGFYYKLAYLIVTEELSDSLVRRCMAETKAEAKRRTHSSEKEDIKNRSAYFTSLLKRRLEEKGTSLKSLLDTI